MKNQQQHTTAIKIRLKITKSILNLHKRVNYDGIEKKVGKVGLFTFNFALMSVEKNPYNPFTIGILNNWKRQNVSYVKVEELSTVNNITFFELIPDSELLDGGDTDTLYTIHSEDVEDMLLQSKTTRFLVQDIYLDELDD